jgi:malonate transporter
MVGVLIGFAIIGAIIGAGYVIGRIGILGPSADYVLSRLAFFVLTPALLFVVLAEADLATLFSNLLPVSAIAAVVSMSTYAVISLVIWRRQVPEATIGALGSGYVNANNIGLPVAVYVLGDPAISAPVILLQLTLISPIALTILGVATSGRFSIRRVLLQPIRNPLLIGSMLGLAVALSGIELPAPVMAPFELVGAAAIPVLLLTFGMSLHGHQVLASGTARLDVVVASALKLVAMPIVAWFAGLFLFGLDGHQLFVVVVLAALPSAQNVFNYAQRYDRGTVLARDIVLITTVLSIPVLVVIAALLAE